MRRLQTLHTPALLIDQHQEIIAPDGILEGGDERSHLGRSAAVAVEQDEARRPRLLQEPPLLGRQAFPSNPRDESRQQRHGTLPLGLAPEMQGGRTRVQPPNNSAFVARINRS